MQPWLWSESAFKWHPKYKKWLEALEVVHGFTNEMIENKKRQRAHGIRPAKKSSDDDDDEVIGSKRRLAFLDLLLEVADEGRILSDSDIREEVDTIVFAGHDTTASSIFHTLCLLANHKDALKRVEEEIEDIFGDDQDRDVTMEDLTNMKYLECCIKETLRLFPSVPFISREVDHDIEVQVEVLDDKRESHIYFLLFIFRATRSPPGSRSSCLSMGNTATRTTSPNRTPSNPTASPNPPSAIPTPTCHSPPDRGTAWDRSLPAWSRRSSSRRSCATSASRLT